MKAFASPGAGALFATTLAILLHPTARAEAWLPMAEAVLPAAALLLVLSALWRGLSHASHRLSALGAVLVLLAAGYDSVRGHRGTLSLEVGEGKRVFEEQGPGGRPLGLRPLPFDVRLDRLDPDGAPVLSFFTGTTVEATRTITSARAGRLHGYAFGEPRTTYTGGALSLRVTIEGGGSEDTVEIRPDEPARSGDLRIALERYFPDFALDEKQQPFTRSTEPRNPAALLEAQQGARKWRVFVIRALPGLHRPEGLDRGFTLAAVDPARALRLSVTAEPAAPLVVTGVLLFALGLATVWTRE